MKRLALAVTAALLVAACTSSSTGPNKLGNVQVSFATSGPAPTTTPSPLIRLGAGTTADTLVSGTDTLIVTSAQIVLRQVELKVSQTTACDSETCHEFAAGPVLVSLPLTPGAAMQFALDLPPASYGEVDFEVHKPDNGLTADQAFIAAHPEFAQSSIRVTGTFNGTAFTFTSAVDVEKELTINPPLVVTDTTTSTNVTIFVSLDGWFVASTGSLIDPSTALDGQPNAGVVADNIKASMTAFDDANHDGEQDH
ncbi:MAG TPA: hypothetical protein VJ992_10510 [Gemmatimonadales bacterium]|nr:hypothetical protein [Gemmatimonadales bacterium]